jgi:protein-disulfide isomerase
MRKSILLLLVLVSLLLTSCLPQAQASPTPAATSTTNARPVPTVTLAIPTQAAFLPDSGCTVVTKKPTPGPTPASIYPPVTASDWVKGPASAKVTIIEYSDFQ